MEDGDDHKVVPHVEHTIGGPQIGTPIMTINPEKKKPEEKKPEEKKPEAADEA